MISRSKQELELSRLVRAISSVDGVIEVILFGSRARGDYDEFSDYDMLVIFENDEVMWRGRTELFSKVGELKLFIQVLTRSLRELKEATERTFLSTVLREGKLVYARFPLEFPALNAGLAPIVVISYDLRELTHKEKLQVAYRLFGRRTGSYKHEGIISENGGRRLGSGCILIPEDKVRKVLTLFDRYRVKYKVIRAFVPTSSEVCS